MSPTRAPDWSRPHFAVIGAGAVGSYVGALLARAGRPVTLGARSSHLAALCQRGLEVRDLNATYRVAVSAVPVAELPALTDVALVTVKSFSLAEVMPTICRLASQGAVILPLLNGVSVVDTLDAGGVPLRQIVPGVAHVSVSRPGPGIVERHSPFADLVVGELDGNMSHRCEWIAAAFRATGLTVRVSPQIKLEIWLKFAFISTVAAACGLAGLSIGAVRATPAGRGLLEGALDEITALARAEGVPLASTDVERLRVKIDEVPGSMKPSFLRDLEAGGPTELDLLSGTVARRAASLGIPTPVHKAVYEILTGRLQSSVSSSVTH